ncbi:MAG TPA: SGNH/GDSL hydrolase family protein [Candidatus Saccharimonadales bacterium]|nr:SGNH/GDSL hydrolase family protein [Candidatus Saccharimonadales bacterium]
MRQRRTRIVNALTTIAILCGASLVSSPVSAVADPLVTEPTVAWETSLDNGVTPARMFGHMDGKVTAAACGAPSGDASQARTYTLTNAAGSAQDVANNTGLRLYACTGQSTLGKDGTLYSAGVVGNQSRLLALKDGQLKWSKAFPTGCDDVYSMAMGVNGNVYGVVHCNGSYRLVGYTPEVAPGSSEPNILLDAAITGQFGGQTNDSLAAFGNGLVVQLANGVQYFSYEGSTSGPVVIPDFRLTADRAIATDANGWTFYPVATSNGQQTLCGTMGVGTMKHIQAMAPDGPGWVHLLPNCTQVVRIKASLNGGVVAEVYEYTNDGFGPAERKLVALDGTGSKLWEVALEISSMTTHNINHNFSVTIRGDVLLQQTYYASGDSSINSRRVNIVLISGATGQIIARKGFTGETQGYILHGNIAAATTNGRAYVVLARCNWDSCGSEKKLYAIDFRGVDLEFQRGAVLKYNEPWRSLVVLGDSFSAGLGAGSEEANGCSRSPNAYANLLGGSPRTRLNLASFVACSGATTQDVINGKSGEPSQLDALTTVNPDMVMLTIGGNNIGFVAFAQTCVVPGPSCDGQVYADKVNDIVHVLPPKLNDLFGRIKSRVSSQTRVLVVGYPLIIPSPDVPVTWPYCGYLDAVDKTAARDVILLLNQELREAASLVDNFEYVDPNYLMSPFKGHEICNPGNYFNGANLPPNSGISFHPNREGQQAYRQVIQAHLS